MQPEFTNYTFYFKGTIDHILHNSKLKVLELLEVPKKDHLKAEKTLPNSVFPSDHLRIEAKFLII